MTIQGRNILQKVRYYENVFPLFLLDFHNMYKLEIVETKIGALQSLPITRSKRKFPSVFKKILSFPSSGKTSCLLSESASQKVSTSSISYDFGTAKASLGVHQ